MTGTISIMAKTFGEWVRETRERRRMSISECATAAKISWPRWQKIEEDEPRRQDGSVPQRRREVVQMVARALGARESEALQAAGYSVESERPEHMGASDNFAEGLSEEDYQNLLDYAEFLRRKRQGM